jgi:toxin FitB
MFLVDTNVISEMRKGGKANSGVRKFWRETDPTALYISAQTVGEIRRGIANISHRGDVTQARLIDAWLAEILADFTDRILNFDLDCAQVWGMLMSPNAQHPIDKQIAAIALINNMTVVTRNVSDFASTGAQLHNPFT